MDKRLVDMKYIDDVYIDNIENLFLAIETDSTSYAPCCYLDEDENWVTILLLSSKNSTQCSSIKKDSIVSFGFYNTGTEPISQQDPKRDIESLYQ